MCFVLLEQIVLSLSSSSIDIDDDMKGKLFDHAFLRLDTSPVKYINTLKSNFCLMCYFFFLYEIDLKNLLLVAKQENNFEG